MANDLSSYVTVREAAGIIGVTESLVCRWIRENVLPAKKMANCYLLPATEVVEFSRSPRKRGPKKSGNSD